MMASLRRRGGADGDGEAPKGAPSARMRRAGAEGLSKSGEGVEEGMARPLRALSAARTASWSLPSVFISSRVPKARRPLEASHTAATKHTTAGFPDACDSASRRKRAIVAFPMLTAATPGSASTAVTIVFPTLVLKEGVPDGVRVADDEAVRVGAALGDARGEGEPQSEAAPLRERSAVWVREGGTREGTVLAVGGQLREPHEDALPSAEALEDEVRKGVALSEEVAAPLGAPLSVGGSAPVADSEGAELSEGSSDSEGGAVNSALRLPAPLPLCAPLSCAEALGGALAGCVAVRESVPLESALPLAV